MPRYDKLVRDNIPSIIEANGQRYRSRILNDTEYREQLRLKLHEELQEYLDADEHEEALLELADLLEVIRALSTVHGSDVERLEQLRAVKAAERGGFQNRIFLIDAGN